MEVSLQQCWQSRDFQDHRKAGTARVKGPAVPARWERHRRPDSAPALSHSSNLSGRSASATRLCRHWEGPALEAFFTIGLTNQDHSKAGTARIKGQEDPAHWERHREPDSACAPPPGGISNTGICSRLMLHPRKPISPKLKRCESRTLQLA